jgi:uncharacterized protein (DUF362 family)
MWWAGLSIVSFVHNEGSNYASLKKAIEKSLELIEFDFKANTKKVAIKPNLCYYHDYSTGETTDPRFVAALIDIFREHLSPEPEMFVVESDASAMRCKYSFRTLGYEKMAKAKNVKLLNLSEERSKNIELKIANQYLRFRLPETICESDMLINVPKIKYMPIVKLTCALKNIYGCNAYEKKYVYHKALNEAIVGINKLVKSNLIVVDGIIVSGTKTQKLDLVMASEDAVAIDAAASTILGFSPKSVRQITLAAEEGIGNLNYIPTGESLTYIRDLYPRRRLKDKIRILLADVYLRYLK